jgi:hypothetical protein
VQASIGMNTRLIADAAAEAGVASPSMDVCRALFSETSGLGLEAPTWRPCSRPLRPAAASRSPVCC